MEQNKTEVLPLSDIREITDVATVSKSIRDMILDGRIDAAKAGVVIKKMEKVAKTLMEDEAVKSVITAESQKYLEGGKKARVFGATLTYAATYTFYDYKDCGHPVLNALYDIQTEVKKRIKAIEEELDLLIDTKNSAITPNSVPGSGHQLNFGIKTTTKPIIIEHIPELTWIESGEIAQVIAPIKKQKMGIKYSEL